MNIAFVTWGPPGCQSHTDHIADRMEASKNYIYYGQQGKILEAPLRYIVQGWRTWRLLQRERPDVVVVQNPPIFAVAIAALYAWLYRAQYIVNSHSATFLSPKWRWALGLTRFFSRRALTNLVHNAALEKIVKSWGCPVSVVAYVPGAYPAGEPFSPDGQFSVAVISSFGDDEPLDVVFDAARRLGDVSFYVTGNYKRLSSRVLAAIPENCHLTGYLPNDRYVGLLRGVNALMALTTRDHTLLGSGFEALALGKPFITSDWPILRGYYRLGTVHVPNTVDGICEGVRHAQRNQAALQQGISILNAQLQNQCDDTFAELEQVLSARVALREMRGVA